jgi:putative transposase
MPERHWFLGLGDARRILETWRQDYNQERPHSALGYQTPVEFAQAMIMAAPLSDDGLS